jgi:hypothetical protein
MQSGAGYASRCANLRPSGLLEGLRATPFPIVLVIASYLSPTELSLYVADLRLPPHRLVLIALLPFAIFNLIARRDIRLHVFDWLFFAYGICTAAIFAYHGGEGGGLVFGGSLALESFGSYAVARAWIRSVRTFEGALKTLLVSIAAAAAIALPETLLGQHFVHDFLEAATGYEHPRSIELRLGLARAYGTFDHPIHLGTFCASLLSLVWLAEVRRVRLYRAALIAAATATSMSSGPLLCLMLQAALIAWERSTRRLPSRIVISLVALAGLYIAALAIGTRSPIAWMATGLTLDPWTGFYRLVIWEYGLQTVWDNPWTGIGLADWERPWWMISSSVDAFWLLTAMRAGLPLVLLLLGAFLLLASAAGRNGSRHQHHRVQHITKGWLISLLSLSLLACTVHYWNVLHAYYFFFAGLGGWLAKPCVLRARNTVGPPPTVLPHGALEDGRWHFPIACPRPA